MRVENDLIIKRMPWHSTMTELNHLGAALIAKPAKLEGKMRKIFSSQFYSDNPLTSIITDLAGEETIGSEEFTWEMVGSHRRPVVIMEDVEPSNTTKGLGRQSYRIAISDPFYVPGDVIFPGSSDKKYQVRIQSPFVKRGNVYIYEVRNSGTDDPKFSMPQKYFRRGQKWTKLFATIEEGGKQRGSTQYALPIELKSRLGNYSKHYMVTGAAASEVLAVKIPDERGVMHASWIKYAEVPYWQQWYREVDNSLWYSRKSSMVSGGTNRMIYQPAGIQQQLETSNVHFYNHLTIRLLEDFIMDIFYARVLPGGGRNLKAFTGEYGMLMFHRAVVGEYKNTGFTVVENNFVQKTKGVSDNSLSFGYQFTKYLMPNGGTLELVHNPCYDDPNVNMEIDPITGYPTESMRFTFLDFGGGGAESNIKFVKKKDSYKLGYIPGMTTPYGPTNNKAMAIPDDGYEMHLQDTYGAVIMDTSRTGELILRRN